MAPTNPITLVRNAARNAPWVFIAVLLHVMAIAVATVFYVAQEEAPPPPDRGITVVSKPRLLDDPIEIPEDRLIDRFTLPPDEHRTLTEFPPEEVLFPEADLVPDDVVVGDPRALADDQPIGSPGGSAIGVGDGGRHGIGPGPFGKRVGALPDGTVGRKETTTPIQEAVLRGMQWLARHQNPDGSWGAVDLRARCQGARCYDEQEAYVEQTKVGQTSLALLCFLGAGISHRSRVDLVDPVTGKRHELGQVVADGLKWLVQRQDADGRFSGHPSYLYNDALATMAVAEAYGLSRGRYFRGPAQRAVDFLQRAQRPNPSGQGLWGWRYLARQDVAPPQTGEPESRELFDSDTSVTTWCVMALKSAELAGFEVRPESMSGAFDFVRWVTGDNGLVGYVDPKGAGAVVTGHNDHFTYHTASMSALGMCARIFSQHDPDDPFLELAAKRLVADLPGVSKDRLSVDYYYWYYGSLALNQFDGPDSPRRSGKYWKPWNKAMVDSVLALQDQAPGKCTRGGWIVPDRWSYHGGPVYATAINVLTLEVYYRYENALGVKR